MGEKIISTSVNIVKRTNFRFVALLMILIVMTLSTADRASISIAGIGMQKQLHLSKTSMGIIMSAFSWAYAFGQIPAGAIGDKIGSKKSILIGVVFWSVATLIMGISSWIYISFLMLVILEILLGIFETPVGPSSGRILASWFPGSERGIAGSIFNTGQYVSLVIFTPLTGFLAYRFGWQWVYIAMGAIGLIVAVAWKAFFYVPSKHPKANADEIEYIRAGGGLVDLDSNLKTANKEKFNFKDIGKLFKSRMLVGIFLSQYCINTITYFYLTWFPTYLVQQRGFSILHAGLVASLPAICGCFGGLSSGFISDFILKRTNNLSIARKIPITMGLLLSSSIILCNYVSTNVLVIMLMSLAFFGKGFGSLGWTVIGDAAPKKILGVTGGVFNGLGNLAGIVTPIVIGIIIDRTASFNGALVYVGAHAIIAVLSYWLIVGKIERLEIE
ncbi:MFS transporter [Clostridium arbusti]|uniref:MFS transporter n=1 Tax=Clostridium arbusti TaxID=1137848 RepID=UPI000288D14F|nr:MFS transporter [Clostridium arbusti]